MLGAVRLPATSKSPYVYVLPFLFIEKRVYEQIICISISNFNASLKINTFMKKIPDYFVKLNINTTLEPKSKIAYFPIDLKQSFIDSFVVPDKLQSPKCEIFKLIVEC